MKWQLIVVGLVALPVLALFGGLGLLAYRIGQSWDARATDTLITGLVAACGGGMVVSGLLLALIVGIPLALRLLEGAGYRQRAWHERPAPLAAGPWSERSLRPGEPSWQTLPAPSTPPPWSLTGGLTGGMTGGGNIGLLPPPQQDQRFGLRDDPQ